MYLGSSKLKTNLIATNVFKKNFWFNNEDISVEA